jgi:hypothetical protein
MLATGDAQAKKAVGTVLDATQEYADRVAELQRHPDFMIGLTAICREDDAPRHH